MTLMRFFKNITHYSSWDVESILQLNGLENTRIGYAKLNKQDKALKYTIKGANSRQGNFITYVARAKGIFGDNEAIDRSTKRHLQKIRQH